MSLRAVRRGNLVIKESNMYYVYILASENKKVLYTGVTNNLERRLAEHKEAVKGFTARYNVRKLVYYEVTTDVKSAIEREKQIKAGSRSKKIALINALNPEWEDLSQGL